MNFQLFWSIQGTNTHATFWLNDGPCSRQFLPCRMNSHPQLINSDSTFEFEDIDSCPDTCFFCGVYFLSFYHLCRVVLNGRLIYKFTQTKILHKTAEERIYYKIQYFIERRTKFLSDAQWSTVFHSRYALHHFCEISLCKFVNLAIVNKLVFHLTFPNT